MSEFVLMGISEAIDVLLILITFSALVAGAFTWGIHFLIEWEKRQND